MNVDYKKTIIRTILWTLLILFLLTVSLWLVMFFFFPKTLGDFCYALGVENMSANLYHKDYEKSGDINSLYKSLNIEIKSKDHDKIIKYYLEFTEDDEYDQFIESYRKYNEDLNVGILEKSSLLNEENYLTNHYIAALIATDQDNKAFNLALDLFKGYHQFTLKDQGVYAFNKFIGTQDFSRCPAGYSDTILGTMQDYFNDSVSIFNANINTNDTIEKAYLLALGNRIIEVGQNLNTLYVDDDAIEESNSTKMLDINEKIKGLIC